MKETLNYYWRNEENLSSDKGFRNPVQAFSTTYRLKNICLSEYDKNDLHLKKNKQTRRLKT